MLEFDTIQRKVRIAQKSIFSEVLTYPGRRPVFFLCPKTGTLGMGDEDRLGSNMNTAVTITFYRYCRLNYDSLFLPH